MFRYAQTLFERLKARGPPCLRHVCEAQVHLYLYEHTQTGWARQSSYEQRPYKLARGAGSLRFCVHDWLCTEHNARLLQRGFSIYPSTVYSGAPSNMSSAGGQILAR